MSSSCQHLNIQYQTHHRLICAVIPIYYHQHMLLQKTFHKRTLLRAWMFTVWSLKPTLLPEWETSANTSVLWFISQPTAASSHFKVYQNTTLTIKGYPGPEKTSWPEAPVVPSKQRAGSSYTSGTFWDMFWGPTETCGQTYFWDVPMLISIDLISCNTVHLTVVPVPHRNTPPRQQRMSHKIYNYMRFDRAPIHVCYGLYCSTLEITCSWSVIIHLYSHKK